MLIFIDYDGTISNNRRKVSDKTKQVLQEFDKGDNKIILTTGMPRYIARKLQKEIGLSGFLISSNGSDIYHSKDEKLIYEIFIDKNDVHQIYNYCKINNLQLLLLSQDKEYSNYISDYEDVEFLDDKIAHEKLDNLKIKQVRIHSIENDVCCIKKATNFFLSLDSVNILNDGTHQNKSWASFGNKEVSKGNAIKILTNYLNEDIKNTIAIGNDYNDLSMFEAAKLKVAVSDAQSFIKEKADIIIPSANNDGVANFISKGDFRYDN